MAIDFMQIILVFTIVLLTAILTVLGIEVFYILKDVRRLLERVNNVVSDAEHVVDNIKKPSEMIGSIAHSADLLSKLFEMVKHHDENRPKAQPQPVLVEQNKQSFSTNQNVDDSQHRYVETTPQHPIERATPAPKSLSLGRRFFRMPRRSVS